jgi:pilus assembly protein CpaB
VNKKALLIAIAAAVGGVALLQLYMRRFEQEVRGGAPVSVLLALKDIPAGTIISSQHISQFEMPERYVSERNIKLMDRNQVVGTRVSTSVHANEPLLWTDIARMRQDRTLADLVQPGMVAASVQGQTFSGLLGPGDRVDVVLLANSSGGLPSEDGTSKRAVTLLQGTLVLAVGNNMSRETHSSGGAVTLLVSPEQAQLLLVSRSEGTLQLMLRNSDDLAVREPVSQVTTQDVVDPKRRATYRHAHTPSGDSDKAGRHAQ